MWLSSKGAPFNPLAVRLLASRACPAATLSAAPSVLPLRRLVFMLLNVFISYAVFCLFSFPLSVVFVLYLYVPYSIRLARSRFAPALSFIFRVFAILNTRALRAEFTTNTLENAT